jgi:glycosyltransferase involved in cell wall biosynthesis
MTPRVSVLVPAHDDGPFLDANLASLAAQSFGDFEAIVADDASADDTPRLAAAWQRRDRRFRLSRVERNLGMNRNWNRALAEARGELVLKLDADDALTPPTLELLVAEHDAEPELLFAACRTLDCDLELRPTGPFLGDQALRRHGLDPERRHVRRGLEWLRLCFDDIQPWTSDALLVRRQALVELGGWDERFQISDTDLVLRLAGTDRPAAHVPEPGVLYRRRRGSQSGRDRHTGAHRLEHDLAALRALAAHGRALARRDRALRQNWWRLWRRFVQDASDETLWSALAPARRAALEELQRETLRLAPPLAVQLEGELRWRLWRLRRSLRRAPNPAAGDAP